MSDKHSNPEGSQVFSGQQALLPGTTVGECEIQSVIGEGGFGTVYLAIDLSLRRQVAIKEYLPQSLATRQRGRSVAVNSQHKLETFQAGLRSFINEARILAQFDHPALVKVFRFWEENNTAYMAMPYYKGRTLKQVITEEPQIVTEAWLKAILVPIMDALQALHSEKIYHRDISLDNLLIQESGAPVLLDFGAARHIIDDMTKALTAILKPGYAPIEQYTGDPSMKQGPWTDVYALAAMAYYAITKNPPPDSIIRMMRDFHEPLVDCVKQGYSRDFLSAIDAGLSVRPEARPQSIAEFRNLMGLSATLPNGAVADNRAAGAGPAAASEKAGEVFRDDTIAFSTAPGAVSPVMAHPKKTASSVAPRIRSFVAYIFVEGWLRLVHAICVAGKSAYAAVRQGVSFLRTLSDSLRVWLFGSALPKVRSLINAIVARIRLSFVYLYEISRQLIRWTIEHAGLIIGRLKPVFGRLSNNISAPSIGKARRQAFRMEQSVAALRGRPRSWFDDRRVWAAVGISILLAVGVGGGYAFWSDHRSQSSPVASAPSVSGQSVPTPIAKRDTVREGAIETSSNAVSSLENVDGKADEPTRREENLPDVVETEKATKSEPQEEIAAPAVGFLRVSIKPWGLVMVNGRSKGVSPPLKRLALTPGRHKIDIVNAGFTTYSANIEIQKDRTVTISHEFN